MFEEYYNLLIQKIKENKKISLLIALSLILLISLPFLFSFLNKGTLELKLNAPDGPVSVKIFNLDAEKKAPKDGGLHDAQYPEVYSSDQKDFSLKLKPGHYLVSAEVTTKSSFSDQSLNLKAQQDFYINSRKTESLNLDIKAQPKLKELSATDRTVQMVFSKNNLFAVSEYGAIDEYKNIEGDNISSTSIRKEPANFKRARALCSFSNGNSLAVDLQGKLYRIEGNEAKDLPIPASIPSDQIYESLAVVDSFAFKDPSLLCVKDSLYLLGSTKIDSNFNFSQVSTPIDLSRYSNYSVADDGSVMLYNATGEEPISGGDNQEKHNSALYLSSDFSETKELDLGFQPTDLSLSDAKSYCFASTSKLVCRNSLDDNSPTFEKFLDGDIDGVEVKMLTENKVAYIVAESLFIADLNTKEERNILNSNDEISPTTLDYSKDLNILAFATIPADPNFSAVSGPTGNYDGPSKNNIYLLNLSDL